MLYADLHDADLARNLAGLTAVPGYCICVDIVDSVALKERGLGTWVSATLETFACVRSCLYAKFPPIKVLGDALMFFVRCDDMRRETAASLLLACCDMVNSRGRAQATRIAGVLCRDAYPLSFMRGHPDYHGRDIDLAFRLLALAGPREVVVDGDFYDAARHGDQAVRGAVSQAALPLERFHGPWPVSIRGISGHREIFKYIAD